MTLILKVKETRKGGGVSIVGELAVRVRVASQSHRAPSHLILIGLAAVLFSAALATACLRGERWADQGPSCDLLFRPPPKAACHQQACQRTRLVATPLRVWCEPILGLRKKKHARTHARRHMQRLVSLHSGNTAVTVRSINTLPPHHPHPSRYI